MNAVTHATMLAPTADDYELAHERLIFQSLVKQVHDFVASSEHANRLVEGWDKQDLLDYLKEWKGGIQ